jgi:hypothetical protein
MKIIKRVGERLLPHWIRDQVRPVLTFTGAGRALVAGSRVLVHRGWTAVCDRLDGWERYGAVAFAGYVVVYAGIHARQAAPFVLPVVVVVWCSAAWCVAPPTATKQVPAVEAEPPTSTPQDVYEATLEWIWGQIGDRQGVHLRDLLEHAQAHGMLGGLDVTTLRAHLERHGFPVRDRVRVRGLGVTVGIHRDDLPPLPQPLPDRESQDPPNSELHPA